jgi:hypothetical protein
MSLSGRISRQATDLLAYLLLPALALVTPAAFSRRTLRRMSHWEWFLASDADLAWEKAAKHVEIEDSSAWKRRWKQVELLDARDLYMMLHGRSKSVLGEIEFPSGLEMARDRVLVGMHWGPGISLLELLADSGLNPAFPFRPPDKQLLRSRPFYYLSSRRAAVYLSRTLGDRAVPIGGAGKVLRGLLDQPGSICILMDAPHMHGRKASWRTVLGKRARFHVGFPAMLADTGREYVMYAMTLSPDGSVKKRLEMSGPFRAESAEDFLDAFAPFLDSHLSQDSPHWRIWPAEYQFWEH